MAQATAIDERGARSPAEIRAQGNRLKGEQSVYLQQHAHNPIDWYPWGEEALGRAKAENKPIFLSIGYSSCHWCHVMEREVFEHDDVAEFMNAHFISIKVDREERPDLDAVYMAAVQALTGSGGWPLSAFLTPDLRPFFGGTYFPHDQFLALATEIHRLYEDEPEAVAGQAEQLADLISRLPESGPAAPVDDAALNAAARQSEAEFDSVWGGFGASQKFPTPVRWVFLLHRYRKTGEDWIGAMIRKTLDQMGSGGIHDHIGGGFHRYTVERTWLVPHFEKMLYDNAQLASLYIEASVVFDEPRYAEIARDTLGFMIRDMSGDEGGLYSSFDADSGGEEGSFYVWTPAEIEEIAGPDDGPLLCEALGITPRGNFEGASIPTRRNEDGTATAELFDRWVVALRDRRSEREPPGLDRKIITSWNGLAITALAQGYAVLGDETYRDAAERAAEYLWSVHRDPDGRLLRSSYGGAAENQGLLDDYAFLAWGLLELHDATGELRWAFRALDLLETARNRFASPHDALYLTPEGHEAPLGRQVEVFDSVTPSGNAVLLQVLLRASGITGDASFREEAARALGSYAGLIGRAGPGMAGWCDAAQVLIGPQYEVVIAGDDADARALLDTVRQLALPHVSLVQVPAEGPGEETVARLPLTQGRRALDGRPAAFVCRDGACDLPTHDPLRLREQVLDGWAG